VLSKIARKVQWLAAQCAMLAGVALATNLLASAGALTSHSAAVAQPKQIATVDRSRKGDRLTPRGGSCNQNRASAGCEASVSSLTKVPEPSLLSAIPPLAHAKVPSRSNLSCACVGAGHRPRSGFWYFCIAPSRRTLTEVKVRRPK
jgi:hypothetical protein